MDLGYTTMPACEKYINVSILLCFAPLTLHYFNVDSRDPASALHACVTRTSVSHLLHP